jgi:hypothetical protein
VNKTLASEPGALGGPLGGCQTLPLPGVMLLYAPGGEASSQTLLATPCAVTTYPRMCAL